MENTDIRRMARGNDVPLWKVARDLGISEPTLTRRLREKLPDDESENIKAIIRRLSQEGGEK